MKSFFAFAMIMTATVSFAGDHSKRVKETQSTTTVKERPQSEEAEYGDREKVKTKEVRTKTYEAPVKKPIPANGI